MSGSCVRHVMRFKLRLFDSAACNLGKGHFDATHYHSISFNASRGVSLMLNASFVISNLNQVILMGETAITEPSLLPQIKNNKLTFLRGYKQPHGDTSLFMPCAVIAPNFISKLKVPNPVCQLIHYTF